MYTIHNTLKISDLRKHTDEVLDEIEEMEEPVVVFSRSSPRAILMSYKYFKQVEAGPADLETAFRKKPRGLDFFINPPEEFLINKKIDFVKEIRRLRGYDE